MESPRHTRRSKAHAFQGTRGVQACRESSHSFCLTRVFAKSHCPCRSWGWQNGGGGIIEAGPWQWDPGCRVISNVNLTSIMIMSAIQGHAAIAEVMLKERGRQHHPGLYHTRTLPASISGPPDVEDAEICVKIKTINFKSLNQVIPACCVFKTNRCAIHTLRRRTLIQPCVQPYHSLQLGATSPLSRWRLVAAAVTAPPDHFQDGASRLL